MQLFFLVLGEFFYFFIKSHGILDINYDMICNNNNNSIDRT